MELALVILLALTVGGIFAWHRIKVSGLATVLEDIRRFIANQNSKDVGAYKASKTLVLRRRDKLEEWGQRLQEQHEKRDEARPTRQKRSYSQGRERTTGGTWRSPTSNTPEDGDPVSRWWQEKDRRDRETGAKVNNALLGVFGIYAAILAIAAIPGLIILASFPALGIPFFLFIAVAAWVILKL